MNKNQIVEILKKIFYLRPVPTLLISVPSYALAGEDVNPVIAYAAYFLSAYAFIITITGITGIVRLVRQSMEQHPFVSIIVLGMAVFMIVRSTKQLKRIKREKRCEF